MDRRQRKLEKQKKKREVVRKRKRALAANRPSPEEQVIALAAKSPFGPCYISNGWEDAEDVPALVSVLVTHRLPTGDFVSAIALVDRTCLGVKSAFVTPPFTSDELTDFVEEVGEPHDGMLECSPLIAQSVVFHAIDYAAKLGFPAPSDFPATLFGPRPAELATTPWQARQRPMYIKGPEDDVEQVMRQLSRTVGPDNWDLVIGEKVFSGELNEAEALAAIAELNDAVV